MVKLEMPLWLAQAWRLFNWSLMAALSVFWVGIIISAIRGERRVPAFSAWGQAALLAFCLRAAIGQAETWNSPVTLDFGPLLTLALLFAIGNIVGLYRSGRGG